MRSSFDSDESLNHENVGTNKDYGEPVISCPKCGEFYVHMHAVAVAPVNGETKLTVHGGDYHLSPQKGSDYGGRGTSVGITCSCEHCGFVWTMGFQFHKGITFYVLNETPTPSDELWRD